MKQPRPVTAFLDFTHRLSGRLFAALALVALLSVAALGLAAYRGERAALETQVGLQLTSVADLKVAEITTWLANRHADARLLAENMLNQDHFTEILSPQVDLARKEEFAVFLTDNLVSLQRARAGYTEISMVDSTGRVVISTDPALVGKPTVHQEVFAGTLRAPAGEFTQDIHDDPRNGAIEMAFGHTIKAINLDTGQERPRTIGVVLIIVDMEQTVYPLVRTWPGLGDTGETLLIRAEGNETLFLNPLRFDNQAALNLRVPVDSPNARPAHLASRGQSGIIQTPDYRGQPVLAAYRYIEGMNWGFVAKKDLDEAFAPVEALTRQTLMLSVLVLAGAGLLSLALSRTMTRPLAHLVQASRAVAAGNLSTAIDTGGQDEIGLLARSFQAMVRALKQRQRQEAALSQVLHQLNAEPDAARIYQAVVEGVRAVSDCESMSLALRDEEAFTVVALGQPRPVLEVGRRVPFSDAAAAPAILAGRPHLSPDLGRELSFPLEKLLYQAGYRSRASLPLLIEGRVLGWLSLSWLWPDGFDPALLALLEQMASAVALAIERSRLFDEAYRRAEELTALVELSRLLRTTTTVEQMLPLILEQATTVVHGVLGAIFLLDPERGDLVVRSTFPDLPRVMGMRQGLDQGITGYVARTGQIYMAEDFKRDELVLVLPAEAETMQGVFSSIALPLKMEEKTLGVMQVALDVPHRFTPAEVRLLGGLSEIAGNALHRADLLETLEQRVADRTRELAQANERLQELDRLKSKFVSEVSHELRTPVTNLKLYLDLLDRGSESRRPHYQQMLKQQTDRLAQLIEDILDLSRLEMGRERVKFAPVDLNEVAQQVVAVHLPRAEVAGLELEFLPEPGLPLVQGERNQLAQVVTNLVANALNYTAAGTIQVQTFSDGQDSRVCLQVSDTGMGIEPEDMPHLFDRFYRGRRSSEMGIPGTGLGLGIVKEVLDIHGGDIEVESTLGVGSVFRIWLPLQP